MRQFISDSELDDSGCLTVSGKKFRHMVQVLRVAPGDMIHARLPDGSIQPMTVAKINQAEKNLVLQCAGEIKRQDESLKGTSPNQASPQKIKPQIEMWLFQFAAKPPKMDLIIRQATECGVSFIVPVRGEFCQSGPIESAEKKSSGSDLRWQRIITEAREQSGSPVDTKVLPCVTLEKALDLWRHANEKSNGKAVVLYEQCEGTVTTHGAFADNIGIEKTAVFVGAEGGISPGEIEVMKNSGIHPVHFATNILRCETAALYGLAAVQSTLMEKELWQFKG